MHPAAEQDPGTSGDSPSHRSPNRLAREKSPYLLQHAYNPVDWYPWGEEAFSRAARENRPVFLSIGYSTCHWCHVMARDSFEDKGIARILNDHFVCIKVDREERPDIDSVYMGICQQLTGQGGWPLTILMTPEKKPFFAGTYFPKTGRAGMPGLSDILLRIASLWETKRDELYAAADRVLSGTRTENGKPAAADPDRDLLDKGFQELAGQFDEVNGGFGRAPKFPAPHTVIFLLRYWQLTGKDRALAMAEQTLDAIRRGGIWDHAGGGLHRYATDARWLVPHFEKMLSDQALFVLACTEAYAATGKIRYRSIAEECIAYMLLELRDPDGGFYTAEDADSPGGEGAFYLWTDEEIAGILGPDMAFFLSLFTLTPLPGSKNHSCVISAKGPDPVLAQKHKITEQELAVRRDTFLARLARVRDKRPRPARDTKILTDTNALVCTALARAGRIFGDPAYTDAAIRVLRFLEQHLRDRDGRILHRYGDGESAIPGFADDYAWLIAANIELSQATFEIGYLREAIRLNDILLAHFRDREGGGFFTAADTAADLPLRKKEWYDGAIPSANATAFENLTRLFRLIGDDGLGKAAEECGRFISGAAAHAPSAITGFLAALACSSFTGNTRDLVIAGDPVDPGTRTLLEALHGHYLPGLLVLIRPPGSAGEVVDTVAPAARGRISREGRATAYLCTGSACLPPVSNPEDLRKALDHGKTQITR
ncbi:thioredoxin domain-containing protein [Methanoregula sp.]|uniref:thioredoxin domain-containing protein n=1 Tax=Methanoregula sp. TaxID=2052170 RepID=UPI002B51E01D|nr:thioredoxin domain-containing protein [Methanoregula sp.]HVP96005.1 thioredoxin domain-containing protein [Methanoregula sp.]